MGVIDLMEKLEAEGAASDPTMRPVPQPNPLQGPLPPMPPTLDPERSKGANLVGRVLMGNDPEAARARMEGLLSAAGGTAATLAAPAMGAGALVTSAAGVLGAAGGGALGAGLNGGSALEGAGVGAAAELLGQGMFQVARPPLRLIGGILARTPGLRRLMGPSLNLEPGARAAETQLLGSDATLTAGQASTSYLTDFFENIAESSMLGGPLIKRTKARAEGVAIDHIAEEALRFRAIPNRAVRGQLIQDTLDGVVDTFKTRMRAGYSALDQELVAAGQQTDRVVDIRPLLLRAQEALGGVQLPSQSSRSMTLLQDILMDPAAKIARAQGQRVAPRPRQEFVSFGEAQDLRSELLALTATADDPLASKTVGLTKDLRGIMDESIDNAGNRLPPGFIDKYRTLNGEWRAGHETYNSDFMKQIVKLEDPELLFDVAVKDGMPSRITRLREALQDSPDYDSVWNEVQGQWVKGLLDKSKSRVHGSLEERLDGKTLLDNINQFGEAEGALFPGEGLDTMRQLAETLAFTQKGAGDNRGGAMFIQLAQAGAFLQVAGNVAGKLGAGDDAQNAIDGASYGIMLAPPALAIAFRDPRFVRYLTLGLREPVGSKTALRLAGQLFTRAAELGIADQSSILPDTNPPATVANNMVDLVGDRVVAKVQEVGKGVRENLPAAQADLRESIFPPPGGADKLREMVRQRGN